MIPITTFRTALAVLFYGKIISLVNAIYEKCTRLIKSPCFFLTLDKNGIRFRVKTPSNTLGVSMLFSIKRKKRVVSPLQRELLHFLSTRHGQYGVFSTIEDHKKFIEDFLNTTGVQTVEDIDSTTVNVYLDSLQVTERTESRRLSAAVALRQFLAYMDRKELKKQTGRIGRPPKTERNLEMVALRKFDKRTWSINALAIKYKITKRAVWEILDRHKDLLL